MDIYQEVLNSKTDPDEFLKRAKECAAIALSTHSLTDRAYPDDLYVVWFSKTLDNWKALLATDRSGFEGVYIEVTHDGSRCETYVDTYTKVSNMAIADEVTYNTARRTTA